jgi:hypothetical protein
MLFDTTAQCDILVILRADGISQCDLGCFAYNYQNLKNKNDKVLDFIRPLTAVTRPPVESEPMLTIRTSPFASFATFAAFLPTSVRTPSRRRSKWYETYNKENN